jgi:hypothetical protein
MAKAMTDEDKKEILKWCVVGAGAMTAFIWLPLVVIGLIMCSPLLLLFALFEDSTIDDENEEESKKV